MAKSSRTKNDAVTWDTVREVVFTLPGIEESMSYGTPALKVSGKLLARLHQDGENIVVSMSQILREKRIAEQPDVFHFTDHYAKYPYILVRLNSVSREELARTLYESWRTLAPKKVIAEYDAGK